MSNTQQLTLHAVLSEGTKLESFRFDFHVPVLMGTA